MKEPFPDLSAEQVLRLVKAKKDSFWSRERERRPLALFHEAARRVPAYKDFLKKNKVNPAKIQTFQDFQSIPPVSKRDYLKQYPLEKLCWDGSLEKPLVFTSTSGSTGEPFYFPRGERLDWEYSILAEMFLENSSRGEKGPTLVVIGFGMGVWIGGIITYKAFEIASQRAKHPVSIITPGINKPEIFHALRSLAPNYKQTVLVGYPPFIKDVLDEAREQGINLKKLNLRILTAAEAYTEKFREYLAKKAGVKNPLLDTLNIYGTADIGAMAWETPTSILMRRLTLGKRDLFEEVFSPISKTPTLAQYNPLFITFEALEDEILLTGNNTIPLIRYAIGDHGGVMSFKNAALKLREHGINFASSAKKHGIPHVYELPFVYVYERKDFSTKLYGAIIYPEHVREALQHEKAQRFLTGKFTMLTKSDRFHNQYLEVHVELKPKAQSSKHLEKFCHDIIVDSLLEKNAEYRNNYSSIPHKVKPRVIFWPHEHSLHFKPGVKQKWIKKEG